MGPKLAAAQEDPGQSNVLALQFKGVDRVATEGISSRRGYPCGVGHRERLPIGSFAFGYIKSDGGGSAVHGVIFSDSQDREDAREEITDYLLERVLPAAYAERPGEAQSR
jgi:hypothetical protein